MCVCVTQEEARNTEDYCESIYAGIIDSLQRHFLSVKELIRGQQEAAAAQLQISLQSMQVKVEELRKRTSQLEHLAQTDDDVSFWQVRVWHHQKLLHNPSSWWCLHCCVSVLSSKEWSSLQQLCEKDDLHRLHGASEDPLFPFQFTKKAVDELGRRIKKICNNRFTMSENSMCLWWRVELLLWKHNIVMFCLAFIHYSWGWRTAGVRRRDRGGRHAAMWSQYLPATRFAFTI